MTELHLIQAPQGVRDGDPDSPFPLRTAEEAAALFHRSASWIHRLRRQGRIEYLEVPTGQAREGRPSRLQVLFQNDVLHRLLEEMRRPETATG